MILSNRPNLLRLVFTLVVCWALGGKLPAFAADQPAPLLVGATVSLEGAYAEPSKMIERAYRLWEAQINKQGGLLGRRVKLLLYDDHSQEQLARQLYEKLIVEDGVDLVLSPYGTPLTLAASDISEKYGKTMIACAAAGEQTWERNYRFIFGMYALADRYFISFCDILGRHDYRTVGIVYAESPFHLAIARAAADWARRFGLEVVILQPFAGSQPELLSIIEMLKAKNPDGVIFSDYPPSAYRFLQLLQDYGYRPKSLAMTIAPTQPDFYQTVGPFAEGIFGPSQWEPDERIPFPGTVQFVNDFNLLFEIMPTYHAGSAYASCEILADAVRYANKIDHEAIRDYISSLDTVTIIGRFKVDQTGRQIGHNPILIQWQKGRKEIVYPSKMKTADPIFDK